MAKVIESTSDFHSTSICLPKYPVLMKVKVLNMNFGHFTSLYLAAGLFKWRQTVLHVFAFHPKRPPDLYLLTFTECIHPLTAVKEAD